MEKQKRENRDHLLKPYVILFNEPDAFSSHEDDDIFTAEAFTCQAEDQEHAVEQCENAYPECEILWVHQGGQLDKEVSDFVKKKCQEKEKEIAKRKYAWFTEKMESMAEEMRIFVNENMPDKGSTSENSQKIGFIIAINEIEKLISGTDQEDFEAEKTEQSNDALRQAFE